MAVVNFNTDKDFLSQKKDDRLKQRRKHTNGTQQITEQAPRARSKDEILGHQQWLNVRNDHRNGIDIKPHNYEQRLFDPDFMFYNKLFNEKDLYVKCDQYRHIVRKAGEKLNIEKGIQKEVIIKMREDINKKPKTGLLVQKQPRPNLINSKNVSQLVRSTANNTQQNFYDIDESNYPEPESDDDYRFNEDSEYEDPKEQMKIMQELKAPDIYNKRNKIHQNIGEKKPPIPRFRNTKDTADNLNNMNDDFYQDSKKGDIVAPTTKEGKQDQLQILRNRTQGFQNRLRAIKKNVTTELGYDPFSTRAKKSKEFRINANGNRSFQN